MSKGLPRSLNALYERVNVLEDGGGALADGSVTKAKLESSVQASLDLADSALQPGDEVALTEDTPVNAVAADQDLTISDVVIHGETVTIDGDVYQFAADAAQTVDTGNIAVDIESNTTKSSGTLTVDTNPIAGDTFVIGEKTYTMVPNGTANADGEIDIEALLADAQANIIAAINGTDEHNTAHALASAGDFADDDSAITALIGGTAGDAIATTSSFDAGTNGFAAATLGSGADCSATNAGIALVAAQDTASVVITESTGTVTATAAVKGTAGNSIAVDEDMANAAWGDTELAGGVDGTVGTIFVDDTYLYVAIGGNTISGANWKKIAHSAL